jgi:hypothetical protein
MKITRYEHSVWVEYREAIKRLKKLDKNKAEEMIKNFSPKRLVGRYHYIYESKRGQISLIKLPNYFMDGKTLWEIHCNEGDLFDDCKRFDSKKEADREIKRYLK